MVNITSIALSRLWQKFSSFDKSICLPQSCLFGKFYTLYFRKVMVLVWKPGRFGVGGGGGGREGEATCHGNVDSSRRF